MTPTPQDKMWKVGLTIISIILVSNTCRVTHTCVAHWTATDLVCTDGRPDAEWLQLTDCDLQLDRIAHEDGQRATELLYFPLDASSDAPSNLGPSFAVLKTHDPDLVRLLSAAALDRDEAVLGRKGNNPVLGFVLIQDGKAASIWNALGYFVAGATLLLLALLLAACRRERW